MLLAFSIALLIRTFLLQAFLIPTGSMENTLRIEDRVLVNKVVYEFRDPRRGEIVVFRGTQSWAPENRVRRNDGWVSSFARTVGGLVGFTEPNEKDFVKRVIGVPGDHVECCDKHGRVKVNGQPLDETYIFENNRRAERSFGPIVVPPGRLFVLGDHRGLSKDSRAYLRDKWSGTVPIDHVIGRAFLTVWPVPRWGGLPMPATFAGVSAESAGPGVRDGPLPGGLPDSLGGGAIAVMAVRRRSHRGRRLRW